MSKFFVSSHSKSNSDDSRITKTEIVNSDSNVYGVINEYDAQHPGRKATAAGRVLPGTPDDHLDATYPSYEQGGYYVSPLDEQDR